MWYGEGKESMRRSKSITKNRDHERHPARKETAHAPWGGTAGAAPAAVLVGDVEEAKPNPPGPAAKAGKAEAEAAAPLTTFSSEAEKRRRLLAAWCPNMPPAAVSAPKCSDDDESCSIMLHPPAAAASAGVPSAGLKTKGRLVPAWEGKGRGEATSIGFTYGSSVSSSPLRFSFPQKSKVWAVFSRVACVMNGDDRRRWRAE